MSQTIRVEIRPERSLKFPAICVHCGQPATEKMKIVKRIGTVTRLIDVPLCSACHQNVSRQSWAEERWLRVGRLGTLVIAAIVVIVGYFLQPAEFPVWLRLLSSAIFATLVALGLRGIYRQRSAEVAHTEKKEIQKSAKMTNFSWRVTTFSFRRDDFTNRFIELNEEKLVPEKAN